MRHVIKCTVMLTCNDALFGAAYEGGIMSQHIIGFVWRIY